uniref:RRM domain-containing protein n=1 Tax=Panagrolaimus sp. JU765 TaxID=591449 RepID=A0AC34QY64_9BILA
MVENGQKVEDLDLKNEEQAKSTTTKAAVKTEIQENSAEPEFVLVKDVITGEVMELPTQADDNTLGLATLTHAFPGAHGLKYKTDNGVTRALLIDPTGTKFFAPNTGWSVIFNNAATSSSSSSTAPLRAEPKWRSTSDQNAKRKKMMDDGNSTDSDHSTNGGHHHQVTAKQKRTDAPKPEAVIEEEKEEGRPTDLIVLGLPFKTTSEELKGYFSAYGNLVMCEVKRDMKGGSRGFGFIQFENFESQLKVLARPTHTIGGRRCEVKLPLSKKGDPESDFVGIERAKLFVGRLPEKIRESVLKSFFLEEAKKIDPKANILDVFIPKPFRSFAFITFNSTKLVRELIKKGDYIIEGSSVSVSSAAPKSEADSRNERGTVGSPEADSRNERGTVGSPLPDFTRFREWGRPTHQPPTDRFNEAAFIRPNEQRKRAFAETAYNSPHPMDMPYLPPPHMVAGANQQALASGFETLNLNQIPENMIHAYSYMHGASRNQMPGRGRQPPVMPRNGRYDYAQSNSRSMSTPYSRMDGFSYAPS